MNALIATLLILLALYGMLTAWMGNRVLMNAASRPRSNGLAQPTVTVLVPCRNEAKRIEHLLKALKAWNADVLIIDDHSTDQTADVARSKGFKVIENTGKGKRTAIKTGLKEAKGEIVLTLDADVKLPPNWWIHFTAVLAQQAADLYLFPVLSDQPKGFLQSFEALDVLSLMGTTAAFARHGHAIMGSGACMAVKREKYAQAIDQINPQLPSGDDAFLVQHFREQGYPIRFVHHRETQCFVKPMTSWGALFKQRVRWGYKAPSFNDPIAQGLAFFVFLSNFAVLFALVWFAIGLDGRLWIYPAGKAVFDLFLLLPAIYTFEQKHLLRWLLPALLVYPLFVTFAASAAVFTHPNVIEKQWR